MKRELVLQTLAKHRDEAVVHAWGWKRPKYYLLSPERCNEPDWRLNTAFFRGKELSLEEAEQLFEQQERLEYKDKCTTDIWYRLFASFDWSDGEHLDYRLANVEQPKEAIKPDWWYKCSGCGVDGMGSDWKSSYFHGYQCDECDANNIPHKLEPCERRVEQPKPAPKRRPLRPEELIGAMLVNVFGEYVGIEHLDQECVSMGVREITYEQLMSEGWRYVVRGEKPKPCYVEE